MATLLRRVYECQECPERLGFSRPGSGRAYYKFPPVIGAEGQAALLFVGINPRLTGNRGLHERLMKHFSAFEELARNRDGGRPYIALNGPEAHYRSHMEVVEGVFQRGTRFESCAAVTELFFCASANSAGLPSVASACADRHFADVLQQVAPKVVICVGARVYRYFVSRYGSRQGVVRITFEGRTAEVLRMPHPNAWMSREKRAHEIRGVFDRARCVLGSGQQVPYA